MTKYFRRAQAATTQHVQQHWRALITLIVALLIGFIGASYIAVHRYGGTIYTLDTIPDTPARVAIVFGGGIDDDGPRPVLQQRLDAGLALYEAGRVNTLLLSGDNRTLDYNEPAAMFDYLIDQGVPEDALQLDFAGRSTYETCERAHEIFEVDEALLVTDETHLPRALYLCGHFDIDAIGVISDTTVGRRQFVAQTTRELFARTKAVFNVYVIGERTVLGDPIPIE